MKAVAAKITRSLPTAARIFVADNTGANIIEIIAVKKCHTVHRRYPAAGIGDIVVAAVKSGKPEMKKQVVYAVIIRQRKSYRRASGIRIAFEDNAAVIVDEKGEAKGSIIKGPVAKEAAERWPRIAAIASIII